MAQDNLNKIFLSASVPSPSRDIKYYDTADVIAIRDAVRALATVIMPKAHLIWGGHPAITPMITYIMGRMNVNIKEHITLYQSDFFRGIFPIENSELEEIRYTEKGIDKDKSLEIMRRTMFKENDFKAAIFIGGMDGVEIEYSLFKEYHPEALILPVASTGAASKILFENIKPQPNERLLNDYMYMNLFRDLLTNIM